MNGFENGNEMEAEAETLKMENEWVMSSEEEAARFEDGKEMEMMKGAKEGKDWRQLFKQNWEEVEKVVELETVEEKVELEIDKNNEVVIKENEEQLIDQNKENVEFQNRFEYGSSI